MARALSLPGRLNSERVFKRRDKYNARAGTSTCINPVQIAILGHFARRSSCSDERDSRCLSRLARRYVNNCTEEIRLTHSLQHSRLPNRTAHRCEQPTVVQVSAPGARKSSQRRSPDGVSVREWGRPTFLEREKLEHRRRQTSDVANRTRLVSDRSRPCRRTRREDYSANRSDRCRIDAIQESSRLCLGTRHGRPGKEGTEHDAMPPLPLGTRVQERADRRHHNDWRRSPAQARQSHLLISEDASGGLRRLRAAPILRRTRSTPEARHIEELDAGVTFEAGRFTVLQR